MANQIRIKRRSSSGSSGAPSALKNGELAFNEADYNLYYGYGDDGSGNATSIPAIGFGTVAEGYAIDITKAAGVSTIDVDLSELDDMTATVDRTADELVILDNGDHGNRKLISEIDLSAFNNDLTLGDFTDDVTTAYDISASSVTGGAGLVLTGTGGTNSGTDTVNFKEGTGIDITQTDVDNITISGTYGVVSNGGLAITDDDFSIDFGNLADHATSIAGTDHLIIGTTGGATRVDIDDLPLSNFDDDITTIYDVSAASVTGGSSIVLTGTGVDTTPSAVEIVGGTNVTVTHNSATKMTISSTDTTYSVTTPLVETPSNTFTLDDPANLDQLNESTDATADSILLWDESASAWKAMTLEDLQDSIDTNTNTTYDLTVPASTTNIRLAGSDTTNDDITITGGNNVSVTRVSATELSIASSFTNTTYTAKSNGGLELDGTEFALDVSGNLVAFSDSAVDGTNDKLIIYNNSAAAEESISFGEIGLDKFNTAVATSITDTGTLADLEVTGDTTVTSGDLYVTAGDVHISSGILHGPGTFYIDPAPFDSPVDSDLTGSNGTVVIRGDLQVDGTTTTINSTEISITDKNMVLADDQTALSGIDGAGLHLGDDGASGGLVELVYNSSSSALTLDTSFAGTGASPTQSLDNWIIDGGTF